MQPPPRLLGLLAVAFYGAHAVELVTRFGAEHLLWSCNVACLAIAAGLLTGAARANASGALLLGAGNVLWVADVLRGGDWLPTALLTHGGVLVLSLAGIRRLGLPRGSWLGAVLLLALATGVARLVGPPSSNVNLAWEHPSAFERGLVPSHAVYLTGLAGAVAGACLASERALRRAFARPLPPGKAAP